ncbi:hypothetical protein FHETE_1140 [Fusarium heterosporum]|uniref:Uncharacterized protein n=1 Tax=Fusarium heterosporum TaxID=42747 RepID=A0A8H5TUN7_FUSHE|nr:hypothetical protein FHETE_1140 [Fusarium heterosporum]
MWSKQMFKALHPRALPCRSLLPSFAPRLRRSTYAMRCLSTDSVPNYSRVRISSNKDIEQLYCLLQAFIQDPSRTQHVTEVVIQAWDWNQNTQSLSYQDEVEERIGYEELLDDPELRLRRYAGRLDLDEETNTLVTKSLDWKRREHDLRIQNEMEFASALIILLFSLCENISSLYLTECYHQKPVWDYLLRGNYGQMRKPPLQKLKNVHLMNNVWIEERAYDSIEILQYIQLVHRLPALELVTIDAILPYEAERGFFVPGTGNMKKMEITHCDMTGEFLAVIISIPKALEELKLSIGGLWGPDGGLPIIRPSHIGRALWAHRNSLRMLDIDLSVLVHGQFDQNYETKDAVNEEYDESDPEEEYQYDEYGRDRIALDKEISIKREEVDFKIYDPTIGSFHDFPHLTHLSISINTLLGPANTLETPNQLVEPAPFRPINGLPPNLEYLCIYGYVRGKEVDVDGLIDELLAGKDEKLPRLKVIKGIHEHIPCLGDIHGRGDEPDEDKVYVRENLKFEWKVVCQSNESAQGAKD